jgi:hypothetical protein
LSAGAFSDAAVIQAADSLVCVFIECDWGKKNADLSGRYGVNGYPTVIFCDPDGKALSQLASDEPAAVAKQMKDLAAKFNSKPTAPVQERPQIRGMSLSEALELGRRYKKPALLLFFDDSPGSVSIHEALTDPLLKDPLSRVVFGLAEYKRGSPECKRFDVSRAPTMLLLDPKAEKPEEKPLARIEGSRSARELLRELDPILSSPGGGESPAPAAGDGGRRPSSEPPEKLSDDELERKFIQARINAALGLREKGKKAQAIETLEDLIKSYPKHVETRVAKKLLEELRK